MRFRLLGVFFSLCHHMLLRCFVDLVKKFEPVHTHFHTHTHTHTHTHNRTSVTTGGDRWSYNYCGGVHYCCGACTGKHQCAAIGGWQLEDCACFDALQLCGPGAELRLSTSWPPGSSWECVCGEGTVVWDRADGDDKRMAERNCRGMHNRSDECCGAPR